jgi:hypothetical protein
MLISDPKNNLNKKCSGKEKSDKLSLPQFPKSSQERVFGANFFQCIFSYMFLLI